MVKHRQLDLANHIGMSDCNRDWTLLPDYNIACQNYMISDIAKYVNILIEIGHFKQKIQQIRN